MVLSGLLASLFVLAVVTIADAVPAPDWSPVSDQLFHKVFGLFGPAVAASMAAYRTAQFIDIRVFHFWKRLTGGRHLWLRNNGSTVFSQVVDTSMMLALLSIAGAIEWSRFWSLLGSGFPFKVLVALADTPLFYLSVAFLRRRMGLQPAEAVAGGWQAA